MWGRGVSSFLSRARETNPGEEKRGRRGRRSEKERGERFRWGIGGKQADYIMIMMGGGREGVHTSSKRREDV